MVFSSSNHLLLSHAAPENELTYASNWQCVYMSETSQQTSKHATVMYNLGLYNLLFSVKYLKSYCWTHTHIPTTKSTDAM